MHPSLYLSELQMQCCNILSQSINALYYRRMVKNILHSIELRFIRVNPAPPLSALMASHPPAQLSSSPTLTIATHFTQKPMNNLLMLGCSQKISYFSSATTHRLPAIVTVQLQGCQNRSDLSGPLYGSITMNYSNAYLAQPAVHASTHQ